MGGLSGVSGRKVGVGDLHAEYAGACDVRAPSPVGIATVRSACPFRATSQTPPSAPPSAARIRWRWGNVGSWGEAEVSREADLCECIVAPIFDVGENPSLLSSLDSRIVEPPANCQRGVWLGSG